MVLAAPGPLLTPPPSSCPPKTLHRSCSAQTRSQNEEKKHPPTTVHEQVDVEEDAVDVEEDGSDSEDEKEEEEEEEEEEAPHCEPAGRRRGLKRAGRQFFLLSSPSLPPSSSPPLSLLPLFSCPPFSLFLLSPSRGRCYDATKMTMMPRGGEGVTWGKPGDVPFPPRRTGQSYQGSPSFLVIGSKLLSSF
jgi:hypothetical protein